MYYITLSIIFTCYIHVVYGEIDLLNYNLPSLRIIDLKVKIKEEMEGLQVRSFHSFFIRHSIPGVLLKF